MRDETSTPLQGQCVRTVEHSLWVNGDKSKSYPRGTARGAAISSFGIANELRTCNASVRMTTGGIRGISRWSAADCVALYACQREKVWIHFAVSGVRCNIWVSCRCCFTNTTHFTIRPLAALFCSLGQSASHTGISSVYPAPSQAVAECSDTNKRPDMGASCVSQRTGYGLAGVAVYASLAVLILVVYNIDALVAAQTAWALSGVSVCVLARSLRRLPSRAAQLALSLGRRTVGRYRRLLGIPLTVSSPGCSGLGSRASAVPFTRRGRCTLSGACASAHCCIREWICIT